VATIAALPAEQRAAALAALEAALNSPKIDHRWWALRALAALPAEQVPGLLTGALQDVDASVRQCAALGLRLHPHPDAVPSLIERLQDADYLCAELAADALVQIGQTAVPALLDVLADGAPRPRLHATRALAQIGDTRAIPALFRVLDEDSALLEYWAAEGLERMGVGMVFFGPD
jgi:HEAT repeat protein